MSSGHNTPVFTEGHKRVTLPVRDYLANLMEQVNRAEISRRIGQAREDSGITQRQLADLMGVHVNTVQNWCSPKKAIVPYDRLGELAEALGTTRYWLMYGEREPAAAEKEALAEIAETQRAQQRLLLELMDRLDRLVEGQRRGDREPPIDPPESAAGPG